MSWQLQLGIDTDLLKKSDPAVRDRQTRLLSVLSLMLIFIGLLCTFSTIIYVLIIFHNWLIALGAGLFTGLITFNIYRLLVMTAMDASGTVAGDYMSDHEKHIYEQIDKETDLRLLPQEKLLEMAVTAKQQLREKSLMQSLRSGLGSAVILTMSLRVVILCILALIFSAGTEIYIFKDQINLVLGQLKGIYGQTGNSWMVQEMLTPGQGDSFYVINANSLLLVLDVLREGLGGWKLLMDLIFMVLFLIPLALVFRSREIARGEYLKEEVLQSVTISYYHHLITQQYCQQLSDRQRGSQPAVHPEHKRR